MHQEYLLSADTVILSTADLHGNIIDYNEGFQEASGYTDAELKGKPHSILRHPDMPKQAFADFWQTIQAGRPWFGIVKNKRKNGDYYWVAANASPIVKNGQITGYLSVRYPATREQINTAEKLYAAVTAGRTPFPETKLRSSKLIERTVSVVTLVAFSFPFMVDVGTLGQVLSDVAVFSGVGLLTYWLHVKSKIPAVLQAGVEAIANGQLRTPIQDTSPWGFALNMIRSRLAETDAKNYDAARAAQIMMTAIDSATTNIMIADANFNITSINASLHDMFVRNEIKLKQALPAFSVDTIVGANMDIFHRDPAHQRELIAKLTEPFQAEITLSGLVIRLTVTPINLHGTRLGYVVEWLDRTEEAMIVADIASVTQSMRIGSFDKRVEANATGAFGAIKDDINSSTESIARIIYSIVGVVEAQAQGDLTKELPNGVYHGQFHDLKNAMSYSLQRMRGSIVKAIDASHIVNKASAQVSSGSSDLSERVQQQAAALEETSATMHEIAATVQANSANARKVAELAGQVKEQSMEGSTVMSKTIEAMQSIRESSSKIADIVSLIDGIAFQTNLLALNAAVEAARAGEHGRGFAVVAGEVRALAQKSAEAAKDIRSLIEDSVQRVENGTKLAERSGEMLGRISGSVEQVTAMTQQIAQASQEQEIGIGQVNQAISALDSSTQQNAALVEETTAAADSLRQEADGLLQNMSFFKL